MNDQGKQIRIKAVCPMCGYIMPVRYDESAYCKGIFVTCKGRNCRTIFELKIENGKQVK